MGKFRIEIPDDGLDRGEIGKADGSRLGFAGAFQSGNQASSTASKRWSSLSVGDWLGLVAVGCTLAVITLGIAACLFLPAPNVNDTENFTASPTLLANTSPDIENEE